jgi:hypothetical protein
MKNIFIILILLTALFCFSSTQILHAQQTHKPAGNLNFLKPFNGKYPHDVRLFNNATLKLRLQKLLGTAEFNYLVKNIFQVETPIKIENNLAYAWGMQEHSGGDPSATILADINKNILYVKIMKNNQTKIYAEDGSKTIPKELDDWAKKQAGN